MERGTQNLGDPVCREHTYPHLLWWSQTLTYIEKSEAFEVLFTAAVPGVGNSHTRLGGSISLHASPDLSECNMCMHILFSVFLAS